jgi:hypothetical protein
MNRLKPMAYESEIGTPDTDQCSIDAGSITLLFDGFYLKLLIAGDVNCAWHARSGRPVDDWFDYTPARQRVCREGPIPEGQYWIRPDQMASGLVGVEAWGNFRITIHRVPETATFGRGGFFIHGGKTFGSAGCIDLAGGMDQFAAKLNELLWGAEVPDPVAGLTKGFPNCYIPVSVKYVALYVSFP